MQRSYQEIKMIKHITVRLLKTLKIEIQTTQGKTSKYFVVEQDCIYENTKLKCAICYSVNL